MVKIIRRKEINELVEVIKALAYKDLSFIVSHPDEALYSLGLVIDNKKLRHRAQHILQMVEVMPYNSIESRRLWQNSEFCQIVLDLMQTIDVEVDKVEYLERKIDSMHENVSIGIDETPKKPFKIDGRWKESTIQSKYREYNPEANEWCDDDILIELGLYVETVYEDSGMTNEKYTGMLKERRQ